MTAKKQTVTNEQVTTARAELEQLKARIAGREAKVSAPLTSVSPANLIGVGLDTIDHAAHCVKEAVLGDNSIFNQINLARVKHKFARGGYSQGA